MMEIGLDLVRTSSCTTRHFSHLNVTPQAKGHAESLDLSLVGYYQASERLDDTALAPVGERVAQQIRSQFNNAIAFVVVDP